jgi:hypothetical protein
MPPTRIELPDILESDPSIYDLRTRGASLAFTVLGQSSCAAAVPPMIPVS